jgi:glycine/betaine/sarcosine/D-proline reductase family selenoprotein B
VRVDSFRYLPRSFQAFFASPEPLPGETEPVWSEFAPRLSDARVALLSTGGLSCPTQAPFDAERERREPAWGDPSWRAIPRGTQQGDLAMAHLHVNTADFHNDHEVALPLRALDSLVAEAVVGASADEHVSVMGYQRAGLDEWRTTTAPEIAVMLRDQSVDGVVVAPNCPDCCKNVPVLARHLEAAGLPTVLVTMMPDIAERLLAPRVVGVEFPFGHAFGPPRDRATQRRVLQTAVTVLSGAPESGTRVDLDIEWPIDAREAYKAWQPDDPSPIIAQMLRK